jgi:Fe-S oxidoreductase
VIRYIYGLPAHDVTRDFFFNVGDTFGITKWGVVVLFAGSFAVFAFTIIWKMFIWARGRHAELPGIYDFRVFAAIKGLFLPKDFIREWYSGIIQIAFVYGFAAIILCTAAVAVQEYISFLFFGHRFLTGYVYIIWSLLSDLSALLVLLGLAMAVFRRWVLKPSRLKTTMGDAIILGLVFVIISSGLLANGLRIAVNGYPNFELWSPASFILALPFWFINPDYLLPVHFVVWWGHILSECMLIAFAGSYTIGHFPVLLMNVYSSPVQPEDGSQTWRLSIVNEEDIASGRKGAEIIDDFTWKGLMDLDACIECGRCQDTCPAFLADLPLSPKKMITDLRFCMDEHNLFANGEPRPGEVKDYVSAGELWSCTHCGACMETCPAKIDHVQKVVDMRRSFSSRGDIPAGVCTHWNNVREKGNPSGADESKRGSWMSAKSVVPTLAENADVEYLFFAGCSTAFDSETMNAANAFLQLLKNAGVTVGVLGTEEHCCGDFALRTGNEELFRDLAISNLKNFTRYGVKKIVTICPHGFNVLRKEYRDLAEQLDDGPVHGRYEVIHHTQLIASLIAQGRITFKGAPSSVVMFSDPCFIGRYNNVYDEPRNALRAVPGVTLVEAARSKEKALCCGGPLAMAKAPANRIGEFRARDVHMSGARIAVTGCPQCRKMIQGGLKELGIDNIRTVDIAEFILESSGS